MSTCYDLIDVKVKNERIQARPVGWDREIADGFGNDAKGEQCVPVEFHGTCPYCGNLLHFKKEDIFAGHNNEDNVKCETCGAGNKAPTQESAKAEVNPNKAVFQDPIDEGLFDLDIVDLDLLKKLESAKSD